MAAEYKLQLSGDGVIRKSDNASIPDDENNRDWQVYQEWLEEGGVPDPAETEEEANERIQREKDAKALKYLEQTDWYVHRQRDQKDKSDPTALSASQYQDLLARRQRARDSIVYSSDYDWTQEFSE